MTLSSLAPSGSATERGTERMAAWWKITRGAGRDARSTVARSRMSPAHDLQPVAGRRGERRGWSRLPVEKLSRTRTRAPIAQQPLDEVRADEAGAAGDDERQNSRGDCIITRIPVGRPDRRVLPNRAVLFSSLEFLVLFLPLTLAVALRLHGQPLLRWIALTSVVFYAFAGHWWFIVPMLVTTVVDYWVAIVIERDARAGPAAGLLAVSLAGNLGMLAYFKYSGLFARTAEQALAALGLPSLARVIALVRGDPAGRHQLLHVPDAVLHHRRLAGPGARRAQLRPLRRLRLASSRTWWRARSPGTTSSSRSSRASPPPGSSPRWRAGHPALLRGPLQEGAASPTGSATSIDPLLGARRWSSTPPRAWLALLGYALPDLLRLQRLLRHGHRPRPAVRHRAAAELQQPLQGGVARATSGGAGT